MSEQDPEDDADDADVDPAAQMREVLKRLRTMVNQYAADRLRLRNLVLFADRKAEKSEFRRPMSKVNLYDRPDIELMLYRRDRCTRLELTLQSAMMAVESARKQLGEGNTPYVECLAKALAQIAKIEEECRKHLNAIDTTLTARLHDEGAKEHLMAKLAADAAVLAQRVKEHDQKMELARKTATIPTSLELKQRLALKYNVPLEEVEAVLAAKPADVA